MLPDTVLLVDDDAVVLDVLSIALKKRQLAVRTATRVTEALTLLRTESFACMMVDKNLDDGSGLELIEQARTVQPDCACMMMTGYPNADSILKALRLGAVDYLEKPFPSLPIIQEKVVAVIARQRLIAERNALFEQLKQRPADFQADAERAMLQHSLDLAHEDHAKAISTLKVSTTIEIEGLAARLDAVKFRHQRALVALRKVAASLANLLEGHLVTGPGEQELREVRRLIGTLLDEH